eukprot:scaffold8508_cov51-Cyclotella_meneghiniana.AAC.1
MNSSAETPSVSGRFGCGDDLFDDHHNFSFSKAPRSKQDQNNLTRATKNTKERFKVTHVFRAKSDFNCLRKKASEARESNAFFDSWLSLKIPMALVNTIITSTLCHQSKHKAA